MVIYCISVGNHGVCLFGYWVVRCLPSQKLRDSLHTKDSGVCGFFNLYILNHGISTELSDLFLTVGF